MNAFLHSVFHIVYQLLGTALFGADFGTQKNPVSGWKRFLLATVSFALGFAFFVLLLWLAAAIYNSGKSH